MQVYKRCIITLLFLGRRLTAACVFAGLLSFWVAKWESTYGDIGAAHKNRSEHKIDR